MTRHRVGLLSACFVAVMAAGASTVGAASPLLCQVESHFGITVQAGKFVRKDTPIRFEVAEDRFGPSVRKSLEAGPVPLSVLQTGAKLGEGAAKVATRSVAQAIRVGDGSRVQLTWILPVTIPIEGEARWEVYVDQPAEAATPWTLERKPAGSLNLIHAGQPVFAYNASPVSSPNYQSIQNRDAYIHPAYSPTGALITGDFSSYHPHHRGFFLAYVHTRTNDLTPDFWNIQTGTGKIHANGLEPATAGPVTARFTSHHRWEARDKAKGVDVVVLKEKWDVEAYDIPGSPYWLFDLTSTQQAVGKPLEILPYRYGGMAYRGPEPFVAGLLDVLTSEGKHRLDGDQKPARWVDLTGPIADGSQTYAGAMIADHPANPNYPNVARIHPITLPFFTYVPAHTKPLTIATDAPSIFRYRILIHDGHPDKTLNDRVAGDFAEPLVVEVEAQKR